MKIEYEHKSNKFIIECEAKHNYLLISMPDRRFRKASRKWAAPALRRNIEYMVKHMDNPQMYSKEALLIFNKKRSENTAPIKIENEFPAWYQFKNKPMDHQRKGLEKFFPLSEAGILYEQGLGKTYTAINLATAWRMTNLIDSVLVICPSSIKLVWEEELSKHCPIPIQAQVLSSGKYKKADQFIQEKTDFQWFIAGVESLSQGSAYEYLKTFVLTRRTLIIIDESSTIKTQGKLRTDRCINLGRNATKRLILSGTSVTQGIEDLYTQFKFLNPDIVGYDSYYSFRAQYCTTMTIEIAEDKFVQKITGYKNETELLDLLNPYISRVEKDDVLDLPPKVYTNRYVQMNPTQKKMYKEMKEELFTELDGVEYEVSTVLEQMLRLQQITGGHYAHDNGESVVATPIPGKNPKIAELLNIMDEVQGKVIIWCQFRAEIKLVADALESKEIQYVEFHGGCDDVQKSLAVANFRNNPKTKVFLASKAAAFGLTLVESSTAIYYSQGYSLEIYLQSQDRIHRIGQTKGATYIHLTCEKTVDTKIIAALAGKKNLADLVYSMMKED
jgi:SNF2 family DNA or RNA helicase